MPHVVETDGGHSSRLHNPSKEFPGIETILPTPLFLAAASKHKSRGLTVLKQDTAEFIADWDVPCLTAFGFRFLSAADAGYWLCTIQGEVSPLHAIDLTLSEAEVQGQGKE